MYQPNRARRDAGEVLSYSTPCKICDCGRNFKNCLSPNADSESCSCAFVRMESACQLSSGRFTTPAIAGKEVDRPILAMKTPCHDTLQLSSPIVREEETYVFNEAYNETLPRCILRNIFTQHTSRNLPTSHSQRPFSYQPPLKVYLSILTCATLPNHSRLPTTAEISPGNSRIVGVRRLPRKNDTLERRNATSRCQPCNGLPSLNYGALDKASLPACSSDFSQQAC
jgi:hypothetical protein